LEAEAEGRKAIELDRNNAYAHKTLGMILERLGDQGKDEASKQACYKGAQSEYRTAMTLRPNYPSPIRHLAGLLAKLGRDVEAETEYRELKNSVDVYPKGNRDFGYFLRARGREEEAMNEFRTAAQLFRTRGNNEEADKLTALL
jgi:Flp pilus assembly protein TadD